MAHHGSILPDILILAACVSPFVALGVFINWLFEKF